ncbi:protein CHLORORESPIRATORY REDUCTION 6, chloroplastic-like isoform X2 [Henckelia pumila]|uniref:protein CHLORORESPIRATORY REDUCTION 6, chloroplastic-like isoform X2 n=1 Tax=Henckelia pumila TaxID=405737 RepID=UPI003C6DD060
MASIRPLYPHSCPLKQPIPSSTINPPVFHCKSTTFTAQVPQRLVSLSVSFNPSGSYDLSLYDDENANPKGYLERTIGFTINYVREDEGDPRELSEFPEIRLWFVRLDATYPWLPVVLDWRAGELARYAAMLVPHQMSLRTGIVFNPEALELFVMNKVFVAYSWLKEHGIAKPRLKAKDMARMLGFGIGDDLFDLVDGQNNIDQISPSK